jgi:LmbE family N-acetylglucosaminyl deacetylase
MNLALAVAAHPDDLEFGCSGTLSRLHGEGWEIVYVIVTDGANGWKIDPRPEYERVATRQREQREAAAALGVKEVIFLGYRDGYLQDNEDLRARLVTVIRQHQPRYVFSFDPGNQRFDNLNLYHRDHRVTARAVFDACFAAKNAWMYAGTPHRIESIYFYGSHEPDHFVDISDLMEFKLKLLACHASQFPDFERLARFIREELSPPYGDYRHAEGFRLLQVQQLT